MKTDVQLKDDILAELKWAPDVHATDVGVIVKSPCAATCTRGHVVHALTVDQVGLRGFARRARSPSR